MSGRFFSSGLKWFYFVRLIKPNTAKLLRYASLTALPLGTAWIGWEFLFRRPLHQQLSKDAKDFRGDTPFYGKLWGYATDYLIEQSLQEGDIIFFSFYKSAMHLHKALVKRLTNYVSHTDFDEVGIIHYRNGICHVVGFNDKGTVQLERYADKLAYSFANKVSVKRLQFVTTDVKEEIKKTLEVILADKNRNSYSLLQHLKAEFQRTQSKAKLLFASTNQVLELEWQIRARETIIDQLLEFYDDWIMLQKLCGTKSSQTYSMAGYEMETFSKLLFSMHMSNLDAAASKTEDSASSIEAAPALGKERLLEIVNPSDNVEIFKYLETCSVSNLEHTFFTLLLEQLSETKAAKTQLAALQAQNESMAPTNQNRHLTPASFVANIYQKIQLFPAFPPYFMWTLNDLLEEETERRQKQRFAYSKIPK